MNAGVKAVHIAARVWCDPEMSHCIVDWEQCERIAEIIQGVLDTCGDDNPSPTRPAEVP